MNTLTIARLQKRNNSIEAPKHREILSEQVSLGKPDLLEASLFGNLPGYCECFRVEINTHDFSQEGNALGNKSFLLFWHIPTMQKFTRLLTRSLKDTTTKRFKHP